MVFLGEELLQNDLYFGLWSMKSRFSRIPEILQATVRVFKEGLCCSPIKEVP